MIGLHGQNQTFLRHFQKLFFKFTNEHIGALDQSCDFIEQGFVFNGLGTTTHFGGSGIELLHNFCAALCKAGNDGTIARQGGGITVGILNDQGRHIGFKAMAMRGLAGLQAQGFDGHHLRAMQSHQAMCGAHKVDTGPTGQFAVCFQLVGHDFGNRQFGQRLVQSLLQALQKGGAGGHAVIKQSFCFAIGCALKRSYQRCRIRYICTKGL